MKIIDVAQGSEEWLALRAKHNTASEASAMMAASKNTTRNELLYMKATGSEKEFSDFVQKRIIDKGHEIEEMARPIAEAILGDELYPITALDDDDYLLSSLDGMTMDERTIWECKSWNKEKANYVSDGLIPPEDHWQVMHQLKVTGASECLYMVTDGTEENMEYVMAYPDDGHFNKLLEGWRIFDQDVLCYSPSEAAPEVIPVHVDALPAIRYELNGLALTSNLEQYKFAAKQLIDDARKKLETDQDFADATVRIKAFIEAEAKLKLVREAVLGEIDDVDRFCRDVAEIVESIRQARLASEKQVQNRKKEIRAEILTGGKKALAAHVDQINKTLGIVTLPEYTVDFAVAMKGKRNIESLRGAVDDALANAKIEINAVADEIRHNLNVYRTEASGYESIFHDLQQIVTKLPEDFALIVSTRIQAEQQKQADRLNAIKEAEERKRQTEEARQRQAVEATKSQVVVDTPAQTASNQDKHRSQAEKAASGSPSFSVQQTPSRAVIDRPTDSEIVEILALHYRVHESQVIGWLLDMELSAASNSLAVNM